MLNKKEKDTTITVDKKSQGVRNFTFENVNLSVTVDKTKKVLLNGITGGLKAGEMTAIMGGSGAGKSTLLNTLAGRIDDNTVLEGTILVDGHERYPSTWKQQCGYVEQDDLMFENLTVYETLLYSARLRVEGLTRAEKVARVNKVIAQLGLEGCRDTKIGSALSRGISGGERKRVSIGVELVSDPEILFLDEPTSGLDAFNAFNVMETLKKLAQEHNKIILLSIHQPRTDILDLFDRIILVSQGQLVWSGSTHDATEHFEKLGYTIPPKTNPSDFFLDTVTIDRRSPEKFEASKARIERFVAAYNALPKERSITVKQSQSKHVRTHWSSSWATEFLTLTDRNLVNDWRDPAVLGASIGSNLFSMVLVSILFANAEDTTAGVQNRLGAFFFLCLNLAFGVVGPSVQKFPSEKAIIKRERASGAYRSSAAFLAKFVGSLPLLIIGTTLLIVPVYWTIGLQATATQFFSFYVVLIVHAIVSNSLGFVIGSIAPNADIGALITPLFLIVFMLFSGLVINLDTITVALRWIQWISYVTYTYKALGQNEFDAAMKLTCEVGEQCYENGLAVVEQYSLGNPGLWTGVLINCAFVVFYLAVGMIIFHRNSAPLSKLK